MQSRRTQQLSRPRFPHRRVQPGLSFAGLPRDAGRITFLADTTFTDTNGIRHSEQQIFDEMFGMIRGARRLVLLDFFLYSAFEMRTPYPLRALSRELTGALLRQQEAYPDMKIVVITDPINEVYGSVRSREFDALRDAGIPVVTTDLNCLRDSNPVYSSIWRLFVRPFGNSGRGRLRNPFDPRGSVTLRSYLDMLNCKANHRKLLIADDCDTMAAIVTSANPHDASSANSNVAVRFDGLAVLDLLETENAVLRLSGAEPLPLPPMRETEGSGATVQVLTEGAIKQSVIECIDRAAPGTKIDIAAFYLSDRRIIALLKEARRKGVAVRALLDPNKDAFGYDKHGIPNRAVAAELVRAGMDVRWSHTHGEQCHVKMLQTVAADGNACLLLGSANLTRRNLDDFNLETNVLVRAPGTTDVMRDAEAHFDKLWHNRSGWGFSVPYEHYRDESPLKAGLYRFMEASGFSEF